MFKPRETVSSFVCVLSPLSGSVVPNGVSQERPIPRFLWVSRLERRQNVHCMSHSGKPRDLLFATYQHLHKEEGKVHI